MIHVGYKLATKEDVLKNKEEAEAAFKLFSDWTIASLASGYQMDGKGYGFKIEKAPANFGFGEKLIMLVKGYGDEEAPDASMEMNDAETEDVEEIESDEPQMDDEKEIEESDIEENEQ